MKLREGDCLPEQPRRGSTAIPCACSSFNTIKPTRGRSRATKRHALNETRPLALHNVWPFSSAINGNGGLTKRGSRQLADRLVMEHLATRFIDILSSQSLFHGIPRPITGVWARSNVEMCSCGNRK